MDYVINSDGVLVPVDELYHWGIKGMKWGQRRYQNKDGSLTPAGKKRYAKEEAELKAREKIIKNREREAAKRAKLDAKKADLDARETALDGGTIAPKQKKRGFGKKNKAPEPQQKSIKDMTDDELREQAARMMLEKNYLDAKKNLAGATPQKVSAGKEFMEKYGDKIISDVVIEPGKKYVLKQLEDRLGLNTKNPLDTKIAQLEKQAKLAKAKKDIAEAERAELKARTPSKKERTADELIDYLSGLEGDDLTKLADAAARADQYKKIVDLLKKDNDKK